VFFTAKGTNGNGLFGVVLWIKNLEKSVCFFTIAQKIGIVPFKMSVKDFKRRSSKILIHSSKCPDKYFFMRNNVVCLQPFAFFAG